MQDVRPARSDVIRKSSPAFWSAYLRLKLLNDYTPLDVLPYRAALQTLTRDDILVSIGGDVYCYEDMQKHIRLHNLARRYAGGSILLGCSIEPKLLRSKALLRDLTAFDRITARETQTLHALQSARAAKRLLLPGFRFLAGAARCGDSGSVSAAQHRRHQCKPAFTAPCTKRKAYFG